MASVRIQRRRTRAKGFRLNYSRISVHRVHVKFLNFLRVVRSVKFLCGRVMAALRKEANEEMCASQKYCVGKWESNVFYAEAIADCLEFIKRSASLQVELDKKARLVQ